jgi:hypothetical protein
MKKLSFKFWFYRISLWSLIIVGIIETIVFGEALIIIILAIVLSIIGVSSKISNCIKRKYYNKG